MKILACFKVTRDFENITPSELCALRDGVLNLSPFKRIIGAYDEAALETSRRFADKVRQSNVCTLHALTVGECEPRFAKDIYAVGFDKVIRVHPDSGRERGPEETASYICGFIESAGGYDMIFSGLQAWPGESGLTPYFIAKRLSIPCIPQIIEVWPCEGGARAVSKTDTGKFTRTVRAPAVYIVGEALHPYLKIATLREKVAAGDKSVYDATIKISPVGRGSKQAGKLLYENTGRQCRFIEGKSTAAKAEALWREIKRFAQEPEFYL